MSETLKVLGQALPAANNLVVLYTVPAATQASVSSLIVCNQNATPIQFRVAVAVNGAVDAPVQYIYRDGVLPGNTSLPLVAGLSLGPGDVVRVFSNTANVSFNLFGVEVS